MPLIRDGVVRAQWVGTSASKSIHKRRSSKIDTPKKSQRRTASRRSRTGLDRRGLWNANTSKNRNSPTAIGIRRRRRVRHSFRSFVSKASSTAAQKKEIGNDKEASIRNAWSAQATRQVLAVCPRHIPPRHVPRRLRENACGSFGRRSTTKRRCAGYMCERKALKPRERVDHVSGCRRQSHSASPALPLHTIGFINCLAQDS